MLEFIYYGYMKEVRPMMFHEWKDFTLKDWLLLLGILLPVLLILISSYVFRSTVMAALFYVILIVDGTLAFFYLKKYKKLNYISYAKQYNNRLDKLRKILKSDEISAYRETTIEGLINQCNEKLPSMQRTRMMFKPLNSVFTKLIIPLVSIGLGVYLNNIGAQEILYFLGAVVMLIAVGVMIYYPILSRIFGFLNRKHDNMIELKFMLMDILAYDFRKFT